MRMTKKIKVLLIASAAVLIAVCILFVPFGAFQPSAQSDDTGVHVRDPYVLEYEGVYYMYGTFLAENGYGCVTSTDLKVWSEPVKVCDPASGCDGGHGMLFTAPDGTLTLSIHSPNTESENDPTTAVFVPVVDIGNTLIARSEDSLFARLFKR